MIDFLFLLEPKYVENNLFSYLIQIMKKKDNCNNNNVVKIFIKEILVKLFNHGIKLN